MRSKDRSALERAFIAGFLAVNYKQALDTLHNNDVLPPAFVDGQPLNIAWQEKIADVFSRIESPQCQIVRALLADFIRSELPNFPVKARKTDVTL